MKSCFADRNPLPREGDGGLRRRCSLRMVNSWTPKTPDPGLLSVAAKEPCDRILFKAAEVVTCTSPYRFTEETAHVDCGTSKIGLRQRAQGPLGGGAPGRVCGDRACVEVVFC